MTPQQIEEYRKAWNKHFAQVRAVFELLESSEDPAAKKQRLHNARLLLEDSVSRARSTIDGLVFPTDSTDKRS